MIVSQKSNVLWSYMNAQDMGLNVDSRKELYEKAPSMTLDEIKAFQEKWVKGRKYTYCVLGDEKDLDLKTLSEYGPITKLSKRGAVRVLNKKSSGRPTGVFFILLPVALHLLNLSEQVRMQR